MVLFSFSAFSCSRPEATAKDLPAPKQDVSAAPESKDKAKAVFAGGCFWCTEAVFEQLEGVSDVVSGYAGGKEETANYADVCSGTTGHAEAIEITYDPSKITYGKLLQVFFATHDPTQLNRQGPDHGTQYRSAVFYANDEQKRIAEAYIKQLGEAGTFDDPIVTTLEPLDEFYVAEAKHQDFVQRNPDQGYVTRYALPKVEKVRKKFGEIVKPESEQ